jgi:hypothetical protein
MEAASMAATMETEDPKQIGLKYGKPPRPVCPVHQVEMHVGRKINEARRRYWYCPVPDCGCGKRVDF